jgi:hypothetical protein
MTRVVTAVAVAPLAVVPILTVLFGPWAIGHGGLPTFAGIIWPALVVAYPMVVLFGLPMHLALVRQRATAWRHYAIVGALLGAVPVIGYVIVAIVFEAKFALSAMGAATARNFEWGAIGVVVFGLCSAAIATTFRAIAILRPEA